MNFINHIHFSDELEGAILGACLLEKTAFSRTYGIVDEQTFYLEASRDVYRAMMEMYKLSLPIDLATVADYLFNKENKPVLGLYATPYYLMKLTNSKSSLRS